MGLSRIVRMNLLPLFLYFVYKSMTCFFYIISTIDNAFFLIVQLKLNKNYKKIISIIISSIESIFINLDKAYLIILLLNRKEK